MAKQALAAAGCAPSDHASEIESSETGQPLTVVHRIRHGGELTLEDNAPGLRVVISLPAH
jgi:hypothetical protein